jgi:hypothetical protein
MWVQLLATGAVVALAIAGLAIANLLHDRGVDSSVSRCLAAAIGGAAFLAAVLWLNPWTAVVVTGTMTLFIVTLRLGFRRGLRGSSGKRPGQAWAEVTFALAGSVSLAIGWGLLGDKWLAFLPVAFMAWGDTAASFTRATFWRNRPATIWPSMVMLGVCLGAAAIMQPYWIGAVGAIVATAAERFRPRIIRFWDDNLNLVAASLIVMAILTKATR